MILYEVYYLSFLAIFLSLVSTRLFFLAFLALSPKTTPKTIAMINRITTIGTAIITVLLVLLTDVFIHILLSGFACPLGHYSQILLLSDKNPFPGGQFLIHLPLLMPENSFRHFFSVLHVKSSSTIPGKHDVQLFFLLVAPSIVVVYGPSHSTHDASKIFLYVPFGHGSHIF